MSVDKYNQLYDYLSAPYEPQSPETAVVFGRNDPRVAHALGDLAAHNLVTTAVITGGANGKDSGNIRELGFRSEAHYLDSHLVLDAFKRNYPYPRVLLEENAENGGQNARFSVDLLLGDGQDIASMTAVSFATSLRRLSETLKFETANKTGIEPVIHRKPSVYNFDPTNPADQQEAVAEMNRLVEWPDKGMLGVQHDLPGDLADFAQDVKKRQQ